MDLMAGMAGMDTPRCRAASGLDYNCQAAMITWLLLGEAPTALSRNDFIQGRQRRYFGEFEAEMFRLWHAAGIGHEAGAH